MKLKSQTQLADNCGEGEAVPFECHSKAGMRSRNHDMGGLLHPARPPRHGLTRRAFVAVCPLSRLISP